MPGTGIDVRCIAVGTILIDPEAGRILLLRRAAGPLRGLWSLVTGWIEPGETGWQAARREVREETGITDARWYSAGYTDRFYNVRADVVEMVPIFVAVTRPNPPIQLDHENTEWRWADPIEADRLIPFHGHRQAIAEVSRSFLATGAPKWLALSTDEDG